MLYVANAAAANFFAGFKWLKRPATALLSVVAMFVFPSFYALR